MSNRRDFLKKAGGLALLTIVPRSVLGGTKFVAPSDQLTKGIIGVGGIGKSSYHFTSNDACRLVAVCDVDRKHLESAIALGRKKFDKTLESYHDYHRDHECFLPNLQFSDCFQHPVPLCRSPRPARTSGARSR